MASHFDEDQRVRAIAWRCTRADPPPGEATNLLKSAAAGGGAIGFRLVGRAEVAVGQIDGAHRQQYPQRDGQHRRDYKLKRDYFVGHRQLELALTYPTGQMTTFR